MTFSHLHLYHPFVMLSWISCNRGLSNYEDYAFKFLKTALHHVVIVDEECWRCYIIAFHDMALGMPLVTVDKIAFPYRVKCSFHLILRKSALGLLSCSRCSLPRSMVFAWWFCSLDYLYGLWLPTSVHKYIFLISRTLIMMHNIWFNRYCVIID